MAAFFFGAGVPAAVRLRFKRAFFFTCALRRFIFCEFRLSNFPISARIVVDFVAARQQGPMDRPPPAVFCARANGRVARGRG